MRLKETQISALGTTRSTQSQLAIRLFGQFEVTQHGLPIPRTRTRKEQWLLALLIMRHRESLDRGWLAATLWPDSDDRQALRNLRRSLWDLRRALAEDAFRLFAPSSRTLSFDLAGVTCDLHEFDRSVTQKEVAMLERAVELYRGPLLESCTEDWALPERETREKLLLDALDTLAANANAKHDPALAAAYLRRIVAVDPFREAAQQRLMQMIAATGDLSGAAMVYRQFRLLLHEELQTEPSQETQAIHQDLRTEFRRQLRRLPGFVERTAVATQAERHCPEPPFHVPRPLSEFFGREREVREIVSRLGLSRLITLTGTGGVGKTRLAVAAASRVAADFPDGVWFVDLAPLCEAALVPQAIASKLGMSDAPGRTLTSLLADHLASKTLLLILDNCEHLLQRCAQTSEELLSCCPKLQILATSRQALGIAGESAWLVPSLALPVENKGAKVGRQDRRHELASRMSMKVHHPTLLASDQEGLGEAHFQGPSALQHPLSTLTRFDAVRLFLDRAMEASATFALTERNAEAVVQICRRLDGIPLAIELAAARVKVLSVEQIARRLDKAFSLLTGGSRTSPARQQTFRALMDWSYDMLPGPERLLLQRLSVFAGGCTLDAVESVERSDSALDTLSELADKSLVVVQEHEGSDVRYRLLETVRQYGEEKLRESEQFESTQELHFDHFLRLAEEAEPHMHGAEQAHWLARLAIEHDNLRAALSWSLTASGKGAVPADAALRLAGALQRFWSTHGHLEEGRRWLGRALALHCPQVASKAQAKALNGAGVLAWMQGDYATAQSLFAENLELWRALGDKRGIAGTLGNMAHIASEQGDFAAAKALYTDSLTICREVDDRHGIASGLNNLGSVAQDEGDFATADALQKESLSIRREMGDKRGIASALSNLGLNARNRSEYAAARALHEESLAIREELGDKTGIARTLGHLGTIAQDQGDLEAARVRFEESLSRFRDLGDRWGIAHAMNDLGLFTIERGDYAMARQLHEESLAIYRAMGNQEEIAYTLSNLGLVAQDQGDYLKARALQAESLEMLRALGSKLGIMVSLSRLGTLLCGIGDAQAHACLVECVLLCRQVGDRRILASMLEGLALMALEDEQADCTARLFGAAERLRSVIGSPLPSSVRARHERMMARIRAVLDDETFRIAFTAGSEMSVDQAIEYAVSHSDMEKFMPSSQFH